MGLIPLISVATVVPSDVVNIRAETPLKDAGASETLPEVSMVLEKNIQQEVPSEVSQKDKDKELVQKTVVGKVETFEMLKFLQHQLFKSLEDWEVSSLQFMQRYINRRRPLVGASVQFG
ncbi:hypothetical protein Tco_1448607 [Tanacetum coccineum]